MKKRFPLRRIIQSIVWIENELNEWIERYKLETPERDLFGGVGRYHDRLEHLVQARLDLETAAFELEYIKRP